MTNFEIFRDNMTERTCLDQKQNGKMSDKQTVREVDTVKEDVYFINNSVIDGVQCR